MTDSNIINVNWHYIKDNISIMVWASLSPHMKRKFTSWLLSIFFLENVYFKMPHQHVHMYRTGNLSNLMLTTYTSIGYHFVYYQ